jgi:prepilin-type N-terminal cleavage/methylation domain-containing protein
MSKYKKERRVMTHKEQTGFTLLETMVSLAVLLAVSAIVMGGMNQMMRTQGTVANRTEMHTSVRDATEVLEQEIGQAGKISLLTPPPGTPTWLMTTAVVVPGTSPVTVAMTFSAALTTLFDNEQLLVDTGANQETVTITCGGPPPAPTPGACTTAGWWAGPFYNNHALNTPITAPGAFSTGIVPPAAGVTPGYAGYANCVPVAVQCGSTGTVLKLYGDLNGDGNMLYVEYTCVPGTPAAPGFLYRNQMPFNGAGPKLPVAPSMVVLSNVLVSTTPAGVVVPCFTYQVVPVGTTNPDFAFVTDVAVTLTVQTPLQDPQTHQFQQETKALLNVSPRNVFNAFLLARQGTINRVQPMPLVTSTNLLYP